MNKILLGIAIITSCVTVLFPEAGISIERATFTLVATLSIIKMVELLEGGNK